MLERLELTYARERECMEALGTAGWECLTVAVCDASDTDCVERGRWKIS